MDIWALLLGIGTIALIAVAIVVVFGSLFRTPMSGTERAIWVLIILMFPVLGAFVWLSWGQDSFRRRIGDVPVAAGRAPAEPPRR
jgi:K+-transporting ATPase A subunit